MTSRAQGLDSLSSVTAATQQVRTVSRNISSLTFFLAEIVYCGQFFGSKGDSNIPLAPLYISTFSLRTHNSSLDFLVAFGPRGFRSINLPNEPSLVTGNSSATVPLHNVGAENLTVVFKRLRSLSCRDCVCGGPVSPQHRVGQKITKPPIVFNILKVSETTQSPIVFQVNPETTQPPVVMSTVTTQLPISETTQPPNSETIQPTVEISTEITQPPTSETTLPPVVKITTVTSQAQELNPVTTETSQPPVMFKFTREIRSSPLSETTKSPYVILNNY